MKVLFGINLTDNRKNEKLDGAELLVDAPSALSLKLLEEGATGFTDAVERSRLPILFRVLQWISGLTAGVIGIGILRATTGEDSVSLAEGFRNAPWLFVACIASAVIFLVLLLWSRFRFRSVVDTKEFDRVQGRLENDVLRIFRELGVPEAAVDVDFFSLYYQQRGKEIKICKKWLQSVEFITTCQKLYKDETNLYLADMEGKRSIPLASLRAIRTVKKRVGMDEWNKEEELTSERYKPYRLHEDDNGIYMKQYHVLEFFLRGSEWLLYFPCYELPIVEELTGLVAEPEKK